MTGRRLERAARRLLREETFRLMVAPAIADLQLEAAHGRAARTRAYFGAWAAIAGALADDVAIDAAGALAAMAAPAAVRHAAWTLIVVTASLLFPLVTTFSATPSLLLMLLPSILPIALLPALAIGTREAARHVRSTRGFLAVAAGIALVVFLWIDQGATRTSRVFRQRAAATIGAHGQPSPGPGEMTVAELLRMRPGVTALKSRAFAREPHHRAAVAASCLAYALFGVAIAAIRLRVAVPIVLGIYVAHFMLFVPVLWVSTRVPGLTGVSAWLPTIVLLTAAWGAVQLKKYAVYFRFGL